MSAHLPYPQEKEEAAAPTAATGHPPDSPAFSTPDNVQSNNNKDVVEYAVPMSVEAAAAPPTRTIVETTQTAGGAAAIAATGAAAAAHSTKESSHDETARLQNDGAAPGVSVTTTRVVTLQPCKIVYHYADHTEHTYVLQSSSTTTTTSGSPSATALPDHERVNRRSRQARADRRASPTHVGTATAAARIPASHGGDSSSLVSFESDGSDDDDEGNGVDGAEKKPLVAAATTPCPSCGHCGCLASVYKPPEYAAAITPANPRIGSPGPVTLFAFGFTTCLYNVHQAGICPMNLTTMGLICFYGGLAQFIGGFFELVNKNTIFCTLDVTYGAFWMATAVTNLVPENANVVAAAPKNYMGGFFMLWFFFAATMFASAFKFSYVQMLLNFSVALNFLLNFLGSFIGSTTLLHVAGFEGIVEGCLATYVGMAFTMRDIYGRSILPLFFQKNFRITEW